MKRLLSSLVIAFTFVLMSAGTALAEHYWKLEMFQPTGAITGNSFNIEYKVLSVEKNDDFTVKLFQNGANIATQNTTKDYGDSGVFTVTVPGPGSYNYHVSALSSIDGSTKTTEDRTLTVSQTPSGSVTTVFVDRANTASGGNGSQDGGFGAGTGGGTGAGGTGGVAGATNTQDGQVDAEGQSSTDNRDGGVLGDGNQNNNSATASNWPWILLAAIALAGASGYYYIARTGNNPFSRFFDK